VAELRISFAQRSAQFGFLDDVADFVNDVVDVTVEAVNHLAANTEEITHQLEEITPEVTPVTVIAVAGVAGAGAGIHGEGGPIEEPLEGSGGITDASRGASARELLRARQAIIDEAVATHSNALKAFAQSLRAQIAAMRRPKP